MAKNTPQTPTQPENEAPAVAAPLPAPASTAERDAAHAALLAAQQAAAQASATQPENPDADPRQAILACSADGVEFWRGGVLFNHEWQRIERAAVGEAAWQRMVNEPRLRIKSADEYGA